VSPEVILPDYLFVPSDKKVKIVVSGRSMRDFAKEIDPPVGGFSIPITSAFRTTAQQPRYLDLHEAASGHMSSPAGVHSAVCFRLVNNGSIPAVVNILDAESITQNNFGFPSYVEVHTYSGPNYPEIVNAVREKGTVYAAQIRAEFDCEDKQSSIALYSKEHMTVVQTQKIKAHSHSFICSVVETYLRGWQVSSETITMMEIKPGQDITVTVFFE
jgi:hypothetical protein